MNHPKEYSFGKRFANNVIEMSDHLFSFQKSLHLCWFTFFCDRWRRSDGESQPILNFEPNTLCKIWHLNYIHCKNIAVWNSLQFNFSSKVEMISCYDVQISTKTIEWLNQHEKKETSLSVLRLKPYMMEKK